MALRYCTKMPEAFGIFLSWSSVTLTCLPVVALPFTIFRCGIAWLEVFREIGLIRILLLFASSLIFGMFTSALRSALRGATRLVPVSVDLFDHSADGVTSLLKFLMFILTPLLASFTFAFGIWLGRLLGGRWEFPLGDRVGFAVALRRLLRGDYLPLLI